MEKKRRVAGGSGGDRVRRTTGLGEAGAAREHKRAWAGGMASDCRAWVGGVSEGDARVACHLCGAIVNLTDVNLELSKLGPGIPSDRSGWCKFRDLIQMRGQLETQVATMGTKLRIFPQSRDVRRLRTTAYERRLEAGDIKPWNDNVNWRDRQKSTDGKG